MKKYLLILLLVSCLSPIVLSQDVQRFAERSLIGTARYVGMGGAMTAIGGDPSAVIDNPAGLGLYRRSELSITFDETIDRTQQQGTSDTYQSMRFTVPQLSAIWATGYPNRQRGFIFNNVMVAINRLQSFNREIHVAGQNLGMLPTICLKTNLLPENDLQNLPWDNVDIGWLSILGYEGYLIDPIQDDQWIPAVEMTLGELAISESGSSDLYTVSWGGNINNQWYIGASLNIPTLSYTKRISLSETGNQSSAQLQSFFHATGVGATASFGLISRPTEWLRIGMAVHTPTLMALTVQTEGDMYSKHGTDTYEVHTPASGSVNMSIASPLRTTTSIAWQWKNHGLLSLQYDYAHAAHDDTDISPMNDVHTLRAGLEAQVCRGLYINTGYIYESSFTNQEDIVSLNYNSIRTDTDYRYTQSSQTVSAGIGYRNQYLVANIAYMYGWQLLHQYATECQTNALNINTHTHRIVGTLAWRL